VVDEYDRDGVTALEIAQEGEQWRDLAAGILVDAVQSDEGIEDEQPRLEPCDGLLEAATVGIEIEAQAGRGDHLDVELIEADGGGSTNAVEPAADDVQGVFGRIEQDAARVRHGESAQAAGAGGDGDGQIESEEGFAALWFAADNADGLFGP
jgi:hypothetical protein